MTSALAPASGFGAVEGPPHTGRMVRRGLLLLVAVALVSAGLFGVQRLLDPGKQRGAVPVGGAPYAPVLAPAQAPAEPVAATVPGNGLPVVDPTWLRTTAASAGIPETALAAYARATLRAPKRCGLGWTTLAAVGYVESHHGTIGDRVLGLDGVSSSPILGPALDGEGGFAAIPSSAAGTALHGDAQWDHALGPMQFITSTWERWGADGDGDGRVDPQDVDDAAWAAARYFCADGRDLTSGAGWSAGVFSYNHSQEYLDSIYATASEYARRTTG